jgi:hypothetical protein
MTSACQRVRVCVTLWLAVYCQSDSLRDKPLETHDQQFFLQLNTRGHSPHVTSSLTRKWVYHLQLLLALACAIILRCTSRGTHNYILLPQIWDSSNLEDQVPTFISLRNRVAQLYPRHWVPISLPPTTRRAKVEVFKPTSTRGCFVASKCPHFCLLPQLSSF